jgi:transposase
MNSVFFLEWFENQLMPALKNPSLVVLDNASYHNVKTEDTVCPRPHVLLLLSTHLL